jgi:delta24-sterol reductase
MPSHNEDVARISATVKAFYDAKQPFRIFHGSTTSTRPAHNSGTVDISALSNFLDISRQHLTATVEPNVPMEKLVQATLAHCMIPPIVMEFPGITAGGGFAGSQATAAPSSTDISIRLCSLWRWFSRLDRSSRLPK